MISFEFWKQEIINFNYKSEQGTLIIFSHVLVVFCIIIITAAYITLKGKKEIKHYHVKQNR